jgi:hypothetical protein
LIASGSSAGDGRATSFAPGAKRGAGGQETWVSRR